MKSTLLAFCLLGLAGCAGQGAGSAPGKTIVIPKGMASAYDDYHYAPVVVVGDTVIVSGVVAWGEGDYETKVRRMFEEAREHLEAAGVTLADVVELTTFHREPASAEEFQAEFGRFLKVHKEYFPEGYPAWSAVGSSALLPPKGVVEMRLVAVKGAGQGVRVIRK